MIAVSKNVSVVFMIKIVVCVDGKVMQKSHKQQTGELNIFSFSVLQCVD